MGNSESSESTPNVKAVPPLYNFNTGVDIEEQSLTWTIGNFNKMRLKKSMIDSQNISFSAGGTSANPPTNWTVSLKERPRYGKRWIALYLKSDVPVEKNYLIGIEIKSKEGKLLKSDFEPPVIKRTLACLEKFIDADDAKFCREDSLVIHITFQLLTTTQAGSPLEAVMRKFEDKFSEKLRKDFSGLLENPVPGTDIKIVSNDKEEFTMPRGILAVRSDVFAAMLNADMIEANSGVINLPDISSSALRVLLNFFCTGELLPEWSEMGVIIELTNAAAKYQLEDLLHFLDMAMGKVCKLKNVMDLLILARQLSLKVAEEELMGFVRREGVGSADKLFQMCSSELSGTDDEAEEPKAKKARTN